MIVNKFLDINRAICERIEDRLPDSFTASLLALHLRAVAKLANRRPNQVLVDAGGGRKSPYRKFMDPRMETYVLALDISEEELNENDSATSAAAADLSISIPLKDESADLIATRSLIEHLEDTESFLRECQRVLKPGGCVINVFPSKFSPFSIINQVLPTRLARFLLYSFHPDWTESCGFRAYYDNCNYSAVKRTAEQSGLIIESFNLRYYQSIYFNFFVPFYLVSLCYDLILSSIGIKNLCCQIMLIARKADPGNDDPGAR